MSGPITLLGAEPVQNTTGRMTRAGEACRFYVWQEGRRIRAAWRTVPPHRPGVIDCTGMDDGAFDQLMQHLLQQQRAKTAPGHPGDPGRF